MSERATQLLGRIEAAVEAGELSVAEARTMIAEVNDAITTPPPAPPAGPSDVADTGRTRHQLAAAHLMTQGMSELDAFRTIAETGLDAQAQGIETEAVKVRAALAAEKAAAHANTPQGRVAAAEALLAQREADTRKLELATALLEDSGLSAEDIAALSPAERIEYSKIDGIDTSFFQDANSLAANLAAAGETGGEGA